MENTHTERVQEQNWKGYQSPFRTPLIKAFSMRALFPVPHDYD